MASHTLEVLVQFCILSSIELPTFLSQADYMYTWFLKLPWQIPFQICTSPPDFGWCYPAFSIVFIFIIVIIFFYKNSFLWTRLTQRS